MNCEKQTLNKASLNILNFANHIKMSVAEPIKVGHRDSHFPVSAGMVDAYWQRSQLEPSY